MKNPMEMIQPIADQWLTGSDVADLFRHGQGVCTSKCATQPLRNNEKCMLGFQVIRIAPELTGKPWDNKALGIIMGLRPDTIRVIGRKTGMTADAGYNRVNVHLTADDKTIKHIEMEMQVIQGIFTDEQIAEIKEWMKET